MFVTWYSRPIRQAMARGIVIHNPNPPKEELDKLLNYPDTPYFNILVIGWRWDPGNNREVMVQRLKQETFLEKKNKQRIPLANAILPSGLHRALVLLFPKQDGGSPTLSLADKEVTLQFKSGQSTLRIKFNLQQMTMNNSLIL